MTKKRKNLKQVRKKSKRDTSRSGYNETQPGDIPGEKKPHGPTAKEI